MIHETDANKIGLRPAMSDMRPYKRLECRLSHQISSPGPSDGWTSMQSIGYSWQRRGGGVHIKIDHKITGTETEIRCNQSRKREPKYLIMQLVGIAGGRAAASSDTTCESLLSGFIPQSL